MNNDKSKSGFWLGNGVLAVAFLMLWNMGALWDYLGPAAMGLWIAVAGFGVYLVMSDDRN